MAQVLNSNFIAIKVDKEERPDIDSIYMRVCQAFTGSGGWPTSIFMSPDQKPFFAGTYFPPERFLKILEAIHFNWTTNRVKLLANSDDIISHLSDEKSRHGESESSLAVSAYSMFKHTFDSEYGGFGKAPKFPSPHNLMFLISYGIRKQEKAAVDMAEKTLLQMYKGGIFDHIGFGFSRYSTDKYWLAPHFEKMLYDNALLAMAYLLAYEHTNNPLYKTVAEKIFIYAERELSNGIGGFYSAQDADSDGIEGKYYVFTPDEIIAVLGETNGSRFNDYYDITSKGNFEGKSIPNIIKQKHVFDEFHDLIPELYVYRKSRTCLHLDNKVLTSWNSLMLWAYANAYRVFVDLHYIHVAERTIHFIENNLIKNDTVYVGTTNGKKSGKGFLDDYAFYIMGLIAMYEATFQDKYLQRAIHLNEKVISEFWDDTSDGFYFYGSNAEQLIIRPKECYDGAIPSGNSVMAYNLDRLAKLTKDEKLYMLAERQKSFMNSQANNYPAGFSFYLMSTLPTKDIVCVLKNEGEAPEMKADLRHVIRVLTKATNEYPLKNDKTTYYICEGNKCLPPVNHIQ